MVCKYKFFSFLTLFGVIMKSFLILIFILIVNNSFSQELVTTSHSDVELESLTRPDGSKYSIYKNKNTWTDNFGNYGIGICLGTIETDDLESITLDIICENTDKNGHKNWSISLRKSEAFAEGIGTSEYIDGTGIWKRLKNLKCQYATKYYNSIAFTIEKCKLNKKQKDLLQSNK